MKKPAAIILAVLFITAGSLAVVRAAEDPKGPRIELPQDRFDFGQVKQGEPAVHVFEFRNAGGEMLVIEKVETS